MGSVWGSQLYSNRLTLETWQRTSTSILWTLRDKESMNKPERVAGESQNWGLRDMPRVP